jgi:dTDP-4-dehydrorhamnose 3,5-epimerase-like enzyme
MRHKVVTLPTFRTDKPGALVVAHVAEVTGGLFANAPRVYWIINDSAAESVRGGHMHSPGGKEEFLVCLSGRAEIELHGPDFCEVLVLAAPDRALVIPAGVWHRITLSANAILLSVASTSFHAHEAIEGLPCSCPRQNRSAA